MQPVYCRSLGTPRLFVCIIMLCTKFVWMDVTVDVHVHQPEMLLLRTGMDFVQFSSHISVFLTAGEASGTRCLFTLIIRVLRYWCLVRLKMQCWDGRCNIHSCRKLICNYLQRLKLCFSQEKTFHQLSGFFLFVLFDDKTENKLVIQNKQPEDITLCVQGCVTDISYHFVKWQRETTTYLWMSWGSVSLCVPENWWKKRFCQDNLSKFIKKKKKIHLWKGEK